MQTVKMPTIAVSLLASCSIFMAATIVSAGNEAWYVTPEHRGECGEECYTAPTAWVEDTTGRFSLGVSCYGPMILGGSAMATSQPPFSEIEMTIDGQSLGRFAVENGMNDTYISPLDEARQSASVLYAAMRSGEKMRLGTSDGQVIDMTLDGSESSMQTLQALCAQ